MQEGLGKIILSSCLASSGLFSLIIFLITRWDNKVNVFGAVNSAIDQLKNDILDLKRNSVRNQLLIMMNHYKTEKVEILKLAEYYFVTLEGDFYMTSLFQKWLKKQDIETPPWFNGQKRV